mmetsp:Transcript_27847/g.58310  ORF Transcript_27847/g.58310 Transcript_27847/m.58310 type:complete len:205 (-) Transcript_27847:319-933(-)
MQVRRTPSVRLVFLVCGIRSIVSAIGLAFGFLLLFAMFRHGQQSGVRLRHGSSRRRRSCRVGHARLSRSRQSLGNVRSPFSQGLTGLHESLLVTDIVPEFGGFIPAEKAGTLRSQIRHNEFGKATLLRFGTSHIGQLVFLNQFTKHEIARMVIDKVASTGEDVRVFGSFNVLERLRFTLAFENGRVRALHVAIGAAGVLRFGLV